MIQKAKRIISFLLLLIAFTQVSAQEANKLFNRGFHYMKVDNEKAIQYFSESIALDSTNPEAYYFRGVAYFKQDEFHPSMKDLKKAYQLNPKLKLIPVYVGIIHRKLERPDSAVHYFNQYLLSNPSDTSAYSLVLSGKLKTLAGDLDGAIEDFERALNRDPIQENYHYYKFLALLENKQYTKAIDQINKAIELNPSFYGYYFYKGKAFYEMGKYRPAIQQYSLAIDINVENGDLYYHRGLAEHALKQYDDAIVDFNTAIAYNDNDGTYFFQRGHSKMAQGNKFEACDDWYMAGALGFYKDFQKIKEVCD